MPRAPATQAPVPPGSGWDRVFYGGEGLRAGWCLARFVAAYMLVNGAFFLSYRQVDPAAGRQTDWQPGPFLAVEGLSLLAALLCVALSARLERRSWSELGLMTERGAPGAGGGAGSLATGAARFCEGILWGLVPVSLLMSAIWACGGWSPGGLAAGGGATARNAVLWAAAFLVSGLGEEMLFRGYSLRTLARGLGFWPAALLLSALFGGAHYFLKPMETWVDGLSTGLFGLFFCWTVRLTGDIWLATGFHFAWNFAALGVFGGPNTGNDGKPAAGHLLASSFHGPQWLTGGPMGPEASLFVLPLLGALFAAAAWRFRRGPEANRRERA
jgi:membrane protease YdiL (CAAX protease family)